MKTIDEIIEMLHMLYSYPGKLNMATPAYREFHRSLTEYIHIKGLDDTEEWRIIKQFLLVKSSQYMTTGEADKISMCLESLKRKSLKSEESFWIYIHPAIKAVSFANFEIRQYADAVGNAFTEIESIIRKHFKSASGKELSGQRLMHSTFSDTPPHFIFESLDSQIGKDVQEGYRFMLAGAMAAIRNPKAHENLQLSKEDAVDRLIFASMLLKKFLSAQVLI